MSVQDILTDISNNTSKVQHEQSKSRLGKTDLDQDAFLQLLMAQLKTQDPLNPMDTNQFMAQQAQLTQVSELQKLSKAIQSSNQIMQSSALIGKEVTLKDPNNSENTISGLVTEAKFGPDGAGIIINDQQYPVDSIISIK